MDSFFEKITGRFGSNDVIKANAEAEAKELEKAREKVTDLEKAVSDMRRLSLKAVETNEATTQLVAAAIEKCVHDFYPDTDVHIEHAEGLSECKKMLMLAKAGKKNGCLIEGMACPGGCIAGAGTNLDLNVAAKALDAYVKEADKVIPDIENRQESMTNL